MKGVVGRVYGRKEARRRSETSRGIAIFRDGEKSEIKSVGKRGGGRKVGSTWSVNAHIIERKWNLFRTRCADSFMSVHFPLRCRIIRELRCKNLYSGSRKLYRGIHDDETRV